MKSNMDGVINAYQNEVPNKQICKDFNVRHNQIYAELKKRGIAPRNKTLYKKIKKVRPRKTTLLTSPVTLTPENNAFTLFVLTGNRESVIAAARGFI